MGNTTSNTTFPWASFAAFQQAIQIICSSNFPSPVTSSVFTDRDVNKVYANQFIVVLKQFGMIDENSAPTELLRDYALNETNRPKILTKILKRTYAPLFAACSDQTIISNAAVEDFFSKEIKAKEQRIRAISFFKNAAALANIAVENPVKLRSTKGSPAVVAPCLLAPEVKPAGPTRTVVLKSGGSLTLTVSVDVFDLSEQDRNFVFNLVDQLKSYAAETEQ